MGNPFLITFHQTSHLSTRTGNDMKKELRKKESLLMVTRWKKMFLKELKGCGGEGGATKLVWGLHTDSQ